MNRSIWAVAVAAAVLGGGACTASASDLYGNFRIGEGFEPDPQRGYGRSGGPVDARQAFGGDCVGDIDDTPDHVIEVTSALDLRLFVNSDDDTTLVVRGPDAVHCDDDSHGGLDPEINVRLEPGRYEVWVGHYDGGVGTDYTLTLTSNPDLKGAAADARTISLGAGFLPDPRTARGTTGGSVRATGRGRGCIGLVSETPNVLLNVTSGVGLDISVESDVDATLLIEGPDGVWCDDDSAGNLDPRLTRWFREGEYRIHVGDHGDSGHYLLSITEDFEVSAPF